MTDHRRLLVVVRHARAEPFAADDHGRRLTARGRRDASEAGGWLAARGIAPDVAFVSSATRTVATWEAIAARAGGSPEVRVEESLYSVSPESAVEVLHAAPPEAQVVVFVGHNPTAASVVHMLDDGTPDPEAFREMSEAYPTGAAAVLEVRVPWAELDVATAHIESFHVPRGSAPAGA